MSDTDGERVQDGGEVNHEPETAALFRCEHCRAVIAGVPERCPACEQQKPGYQRIVALGGK